MADANAAPVPGVPDLLETLWEDTVRTVASAVPAVRARAADCALVALCEAAVSARDAGFRSTARALATGGRCTVPGTAGAGPAEALVANGFLVHAGLADDAYRVAHHPGLTVVPAALATAEAHRRADLPLPVLLEAIALGYEFSCRLADLFLPAASERGWRITALLAPLVASAVSAWLLHGPSEPVRAARLAAAAMGGPIFPVNTRGDWRLQPALAGAPGMLAAMAAPTAPGTPKALECSHGPLALFTGAPAPALAGGPRLPHVTFKRHGAAMYGQAIYDAIERLDTVASPIEAIDVTVPRFAAGYAGQEAATADAVSSVAGITRAALASLHPGSPAPPLDQIRVHGDDAVDRLGAEVAVTLGDGRRLVSLGSGDTSGWTRADVTAHCARRVGDGVEALAATLSAPEATVADLVASWSEAAAASGASKETTKAGSKRGRIS